PRHAPGPAARRPHLAALRRRGRQGVRLDHPPAERRRREHTSRRSWSRQRARAADLHRDRPRARRREHLPAVHGPADLLRREAHRSPSARRGGHPRIEPVPPVRSRHVAAHHAWRHRGHSLRVLDVGVDVRDPHAPRRRPLQDAVDPDRPLVPLHARPLARIHCFRRAAADRGRRCGRERAPDPPLATQAVMGIERAAAIAMWTVTALVVLTLLAPLAVTLAVSVSASSVFNLPPPALSTRWYERVLRSRELWPSVRLSLEIALLSTVIALVLGTLCAMAIARGTFPGKTALTTFMVAPLMMPGLVVGVAMLQALRQIGLRDAFASLLIGHVVITLPYVTRTVLA